MKKNGGGPVVNTIAFNSDNPSSDPAEVFNFSVIIVVEKINDNTIFCWFNFYAYPFS